MRAQVNFPATDDRLPHTPLVSPGRECTHCPPQSVTPISQQSPTTGAGDETRDAGEERTLAAKLVASREGTREDDQLAQLNHNTLLPTPQVLL